MPHISKTEVARKTVECIDAKQYRELNDWLHKHNLTEAEHSPLIAHLYEKEGEYAAALGVYRRHQHYMQMYKSKASFRVGEALCYEKLGYVEAARVICLEIINCKTRTGPDAIACTQALYRMGFHRDAINCAADIIRRDCDPETLSTAHMWYQRWTAMHSDAKKGKDATPSPPPPPSPPKEPGDAAAAAAASSADKADTGKRSAKKRKATPGKDDDDDDDDGGGHASGKKDPEPALADQVTRLSDLVSSLAQYARLPLCVICTTRVVSTRIDPCGHVILCAICARNTASSVVHKPLISSGVPACTVSYSSSSSSSPALLSDCPICRRRIEMVESVVFS